MPRRDLWKIITLSNWLKRHPAEDVQQAYSQIFDLQHSVTDWYVRFVDYQGSMLLLTDETKILGLSNWLFPIRTRSGDGGVFGDIGLIENRASATAARGLVQQKLVHLRSAVRRHHRTDLRYTVMHVRVDDRRLMKLCLQAGFTRHGILTNRFENLGSFVETYMLHLPLRRPN